MMRLLMQKIKNRLYIAVLKMILYDRDKLWLTGKQKSQIVGLIRKLERITYG